LKFMRFAETQLCRDDTEALDNFVDMLENAKSRGLRCAHLSSYPNRLASLASASGWPERS
jgi:hypothetical protein